jgi:hypothetical protein
METPNVSSLGTACALCDGSLNPCIDLPGLPITETLLPPGETRESPGFDQRLNLCGSCGHGQLEALVDPDFLYGSQYSFRSSDSASAMRGARFFEDFVARISGNAPFNSILDFGCNDGFLIRSLKSRTKHAVGIDPIVEPYIDELAGDGVVAIADTIENVDLEALPGGVPDLVVSTHTMEHIRSPRAVLESILTRVDDDTTIVCEFPCFDLLLNNLRFDQIFHEHLHYFSLGSICSLLSRLGAEVTDWTFNYHQWGALLIAFRKRSGGSVDDEESIARDGEAPKIRAELVNARFDLFKMALAQLSEVMEIHSRRTPIFGYGAARMLPVLAYHLGEAFGLVDAILDDHPVRNTFQYCNLDVPVRSSENVDFASSAFLVTALDSTRPIMRSLFDKGARTVMHPFPIF